MRAPARTDNNYHIINSVKFDYLRGFLPLRRNKRYQPSEIVLGYLIHLESKGATPLPLSYWVLIEIIALPVYTGG